MTFHQGMYRRYPKKQDHGTRGGKRESLLHWGNMKKGVKIFAHEQLLRERSNNKIELNKLKFGYDDEDIEKYLLRTQFVLHCSPWDFDQTVFLDLTSNRYLTWFNNKNTAVLRSNTEDALRH